MSANVIRYPRYKRVTSGFVLLFFALWVVYLLISPPSAAGTTRGTLELVGKPAPNFELKGIDGQTYKLADLKGKPVMLNFFATWCPPCRNEMPAIQEAYKQYADQGFVVIAVNLNESEMVVKNFKDKLGLTFPIVIDTDDRVTKAYDIVPLPTSFFVNKDGVIQFKHTGELTKDQLTNYIKQLL